MDKKTEKPKITDLRKQTLKVMKIETHLKAGLRITATGCPRTCGTMTLSQVGTC